MNILIIEDEKETLSFLKVNLSNCGFIVDGVSTGQKGLNLINKNSYDIIILDLILPDLNGKKICETLRQENKTMPILVLSANEKTESKISPLNSGIDDYMEKPFYLDELVARIKALSRRPLEISNNFLKIKDIELDRRRQIIKRAKKEVYLTKKEFLLLEYMMSHLNIVISRDEMMEHVWDMKANLFSKTIETHILHLRKKLDSGRSKPLIKTISGRGYKFG